MTSDLRSCSPHGVWALKAECVLHGLWPQKQGRRSPIWIQFLVWGFTGLSPSGSRICSVLGSEVLGTWGGCSVGMRSSWQLLLSRGSSQWWSLFSPSSKISFYKLESLMGWVWPSGHPFYCPNADQEGFLYWCLSL